MRDSSRSERSAMPKDWDRRFAAEAARLRLHYCNLFKFWRDCRIKSCKRHRRCCGDTNECLKRRIGEIPRMAQFQARQAVVAATRPEYCITHAPGCMLITDLRNTSLASL